MAERQKAWLDRLALMSNTTGRLFKVAGEVVEDAIQHGAGTMLILLNDLTYQHALGECVRDKVPVARIVGLSCYKPGARPSDASKVLRRIISIFDVWC